MSDETRQSEQSTTQDRTPSGTGGVRLTLNSPKNARRTLARLMRARASGKIDRDSFRDLVYSFEKFLGLMKFEQDLQIEERLERIEQELADRRIR